MPYRQHRRALVRSRGIVVGVTVAASAVAATTVALAGPGAAAVRRPSASFVSTAGAGAPAAPSASAAGTATRVAGVRYPPPRLVGGRAATPRPLVRQWLGVASVDPVCRIAGGFTRTGDGGLYRLQDGDVLGGPGTVTDLGQVGSGWTGSGFAWIGAGGDGVLYALTWSGALLWYRYDAQAQSWASGSGRTIGAGFVPRTKIANIALGGDGSFYVVRANGQLVIYRHTGRLTGAAGWANPAGWVIGSGWTGDEIIAPNGDGTVYRQYRGQLLWYRHTDPALGSVSWTGPQVIGTGWRFYDLLPAGGGVLYGTQGGTGAVYAYRHTDPSGGANQWAASEGTQKYTARPDSFGITIDPMACTLPS